MNIFYSWQSDTQGKVSKQFIRRALDEASNLLSDELQLEEAERLSVDQDTQGILGSPSIADTILFKITQADVVVADVSLTGSTPEGKRLINSNVAYELGYAHHSGGDQVLLKVMNTHFGPASDLPFDLAHKRWPVQYDLAPGSDKATRDRVEKSLIRELKRILQAYRDELQPSVTSHSAIETTYNDASFWNEGELLLNNREEVGGNTVVVEYDYDRHQPLLFARIQPATAIPAIPSEILKKYIHHNCLPVLDHKHSSFFRDRNKHGCLSYTLNSEQNLAASTQLFKNGELWAHCAYLLNLEDAGNYYVPTTATEEIYLHVLPELMHIAKTELGYTKQAIVTLGIVQAEEHVITRAVRGYSGPLNNNVIVTHTVEISDKAAIDKLLLDFFEAIHNEVGLTRPPHHNGFPPLD